MNAFDDPIEETQASLSLARNTYKQWKDGEIDSVIAGQRIGQAASQLEVTRAIWMETARQGVSRLSTRTERELLNFYELVKGIDNQKDYGVSLLEHVLRDALVSLESGLELKNAHDTEEAVSLVLSSCTNVLAIKSALLETLSLKATIEADGPTTQVEELKKRQAVIIALQNRLQKAVQESGP